MWGGSSSAKTSIKWWHPHVNLSITSQKLMKSLTLRGTNAKETAIESGEDLPETFVAVRLHQSGESPKRLLRRFPFKSEAHDLQQALIEPRKHLNLNFIAYLPPSACIFASTELHRSALIAENRTHAEGSTSDDLIRGLFLKRDHQRVAQRETTLKNPQFLFLLPIGPIGCVGYNFLESKRLTASHCAWTTWGFHKFWKGFTAINILATRE